MSLHHPFKKLNNPKFQALSRSLWPVVTPALLALWLVLAMGWWWQQGMPNQIRDTAAEIDCLSYAPFRRPGATPFNAAGSVTPAQIEADLRLLQSITPCVRTYGVGNGLDAVPQIARQLGMRVRLGAWLGQDQNANRIELDRALALARTHTDVIDVLIVGNEVLLRKDLSVAELRAHLVFAKANSRVPVTYADVWEFWRVNASLQDQVDWVTIHILPYWEDTPVAAQDAAAHVLSTARSMQATFATKPIWIGETGWPAAGRQRGLARPGTVEQARVLRDIVTLAKTEKLSVNVVEAFDQPWKKALEGAMGGAWGMFRADGTQRAQLSGDAIEDPFWIRGWASALAGGLIATAMGWIRNVRAKPGPQRLAIQDLALLGLGGALLGAMLPLQWDYLALWSRDNREFALAVLANCMVLTGAVFLLLDLVDWRGKSTAKLRSYVALAALFTATWWALILLFDARYRGFPLALFAAPACFSMCLVVKSWTTCESDRNDPRNPVTPDLASDQHRFLASMLCIASIAIVFNEGVENLQALGLCSFWFAVAANSWRRNPSCRTIESPANNNPGAANSAL